MKLCIPIRYKPEGGLYSFVANFLAYLDARGVAYTQSLADDYDALFVNSWVVPYATVARIKRARRGLTVTQRVDGAGQDYGRGAEADREQARVNMLADQTIFQSGYARYATREKFRVIAQDGPVIHNPVNLDRFSPEGPRRDFPEAADRPRLINVSFSTNRLKGTWRISELAARHPDLQFVLCGRYEGIPARENITILGHLDPDAVAAVLRSGDAFLDLTENEACPNVILEAMASGLPIIHNASGAVPELVGDTGVAFRSETFREDVARALKARRFLGVAARARAEDLFDPGVVFPRYLEVIRSATRHTDPSARTTIALARQGYPVWPRPLVAARSWAGALYRGSRRPAVGTRRIGWVTYDSFGRRKRRFDQLDSFTKMRTGVVAQWMNEHDSSVHHEIYRPQHRYDLVVFQKMMDEPSRSEAARIQAYGGKVVFDANVNYYEVWGDYFVPGTKPTPELTTSAIEMTTLADWVVADSSYLEQVIRKLTTRVTWIADNVNTKIYSGSRVHESTHPVRLVWSGIGKKAAHLLLVRDVLSELGDRAELVLVVDEPPPFLAELEGAIHCEVVRFSDERYARTLETCDIIISPKRLVNGYEMGHTEYKITLGMAVGLPAVASPQQSYVEAIGYAGGGIIADTSDEWREALTLLIARPEMRRAMGAAARRTVHERYATPMIARQYYQLLQDVLGRVTPQPDDMVPA